MLFPHAVAPEKFKELPEEEDWLECRGTRERQAEYQRRQADDQRRATQIEDKIATIEC